MPTENAEVRLVIENRFEDLDLLDSVCDAVLAYVGLEGDNREHTSLAIREAAANAIEHGNGVGSDKQVDITMQLEAELLIVRVRDEGDGFDPDAVPDPLAPENLLKPRGRGIFLSRRFVDEIDYEFEGGTVMILRKRLGGAGDAPDESE